MALFRAMWVEDRDVADPDVVGRVVDDLGLSGDEVVELADDPEVKNRLKAVSDEAVDRGAFGAPTFFVDGAMFWGNDRLHFVEDAVSE